MKVGDAFEHAGGVAAVHAPKAPLGAVQLRFRAGRPGADAGGVANGFRGIGDEHGRQRADQHLEIVATVAAKHDEFGLEGQIVRDRLDRVQLGRTFRQHVEQPLVFRFVHAEHESDS